MNEVNWLGWTAGVAVPLIVVFGPILIDWLKR